MQISYENSKIEKVCSDDKAAKKELGQYAKFLRERIEAIAAAENLEALRTARGRFHELSQNRKGQIVCSISGILRLIFNPDHEPVPVKSDGGLDWSQVTAVTFIEITDYHE